MNEYINEFINLYEDCPLVGAEYVLCQHNHFTKEELALIIMQLVKSFDDLLDTGCMFASEYNEYFENVCEGVRRSVKSYDKIVKK